MEEKQDVSGSVFLPGSALIKLWQISAGIIAAVSAGALIIGIFQGNAGIIISTIYGAGMFFLCAFSVVAFLRCQHVIIRELNSIRKSFDSQ